MKKLLGVATVVTLAVAAGLTFWPSGKAHATGTVTLTLNQTVLVASNIDVPPQAAFTPQPLPGVFITKACVRPSVIVDAANNGAGIAAYIGGLIGQVAPVEVGVTWGGADQSVTGGTVALSAPSVTFSATSESQATQHLNNVYLFCGK